MTTLKKPNEIDISKLVETYWNNKILVLGLIIFFGLIGYFYSKTFKVETQYTSVVIIKYPDSDLFIKYSDVLAGESDSLEDQLITEIELNLTSHDLLVKFIEQSDKYDNFKSYLSENNYFLSSYMEGKFFKWNPDINNGYGLIYPEILKGNEFLNEYLGFIRAFSTNKIKSRMEKKLNNKIMDLKRHLAIAEDINLDKSLIQSMSSKETNVFFTYPPDENYYKGKIILDAEIDNLKKLSLELNESEFYYNPVLDKAKIVYVDKNNFNIYIFVGLITGFFLSSIIIFLRKFKFSDN